MDNKYASLAEREPSDVKDSDDDADIEVKLKKAEERFINLTKRRATIEQDKVIGPETPRITEQERENEIQIDNKTVVYRKADTGHESELRGGSSDIPVNTNDIDIVNHDRK